MRRVKQVRWLTVLAVAGILFMSGGCGGGGGSGGNDDVGATGTGNDTTPNAFSFVRLTGVPPGSESTSNTITVTGIDAPAPISISGGGGYSINGRAFTSTTGTVNTGETVAVRHTASTTYSTVTTSTLTIGDVTATFTTTTAPPAGADTVPTPFSFAPQTNVPIGTAVTSNPITVTGIDSPAPISISGGGGTYSIDGAAFTSADGTVNNAQTVRVQHISSATNSTATTTTLAIGGISALFRTTTIGSASGDTTPDAFSFTQQEGVPLSTTVISNAITVRGIDAPARISVGSGEYSIDGGLYTSAPGTVTNGQTVTVRHNSAGTPVTATSTTLTIGGVYAYFDSITLTLVDAAGLYQARCAECHRLGTIDTTGTAANLSGNTWLSAYFLWPTSVHYGVSLSAEERVALTIYFRDN